MLNKQKIEISNSDVVLSVNGINSKTTSVASFVNAIQANGNCKLFPDIIPDGVKYVEKRHGFNLIIVEQMAKPRGVFVIADDSPQPYGSKVKSVRRWLSFPYVYMLILFHREFLTDFVQVFYRTAPLKTLNDSLLLCNLPNVSKMGPVPFWFCTQYIGDLRSFIWPDKIKLIIDHLWKTGFNWSSDHHEGLSQFTAMKELDKRIASFKNWEKATKVDPNFTLKIKWKSADLTVRKAIDTLFNFATIKNEIIDCQGLVGMIQGKNQKQSLFSE